MTSPPPLPCNREAFDAVTAGQWQALFTGPVEELAHWLQAAARFDHPQAQAMLGQLLLDGRGVERDAAHAYDCFARAADQGLPMAMNMRARCLEHGWGVAPDPLQAAGWYLRAAQAGLDWGMYNYANFLSSGRVLQQDHARALMWYRKAATLGHAKSLNLVGRYYEEGVVVEADRATAFKYYRASAEGGDFRGQYSYACMLAERGRIDDANVWLAKIPASATTAFMKKIGHELQLSGHPSFRQMGNHMLQLAASR